MVDRRENSGGFDRFTGVVSSVELEDSKLKDTNGNTRKQYHLQMTPVDVKIAGKTGKIHEWISMSATSKEDEVAPDSVMDKFLRRLEASLPSAKNAKTVSEALNLMKGKKFLFIKEVLGRAYEGNQPQPMWVPQVLI